MLPPEECAAASRGACCGPRGLSCRDQPSVLWSDQRNVLPRTEGRTLLCCRQRGSAVLRTGNVAAPNRNFADLVEN